MSESVIDGFHVRSAFGVSQHHHVVEMSVTMDILDHEQRNRHLISPDEALRIAANLVTAAHSALRSQIRDALAGECQACANRRMVDKGRPVGLEHCDCVKDMPPIPTMEAWAPRERAVL